MYLVCIKSGNEWFPVDFWKHEDIAQMEKERLESRGCIVCIRFVAMPSED